MNFSDSRLTIAIITKNQERARLDRKALGLLNFGRVMSFASGREALAFLRESEAALALSDYELEDMVGTDLIKLIKRDRKSRFVPVVMVTEENRKEIVLDAISAGCSGYVLRPYSISTLEKHLALARELGRFSEIEEEQLAGAKNLIAEGEFDAAIEELEEVISVSDDAQRYFDMGTRYLVEQKYGKAIIAFNKAVKLNELFAEAYKGLADAHKGKGNGEMYQKCLRKAADIFAMQDRFQETKELFTEILKCDSAAINPYNSLGVTLRKQGDYAGALHAYRQALAITPGDENLLYNISKAYLYAGDNDAALRHISSALDGNPTFAEGLELFARISGAAWQGQPARRPAKSRASLMLKDE